MCRWIAYRGETIALEYYVTEPAHSLISQSMHALESTAALNGDGFGLGWYGEHPEPGLYRELRPAWSDENLRHLCRHLRSHLFFAHVRAATETAVTRTNCHPFAWGPWMFMHNGLIGNWTRLRREVEALIADDLYPSRAGTTDSEAIFLAILGAGLVGSGERKNPVAAVRATASELTRLVRAKGEGAPFRFTAALANGEDLYAFRYAVNTGSNSLYYRAVGDDVAIVSEPLDRDHENWAAVPENTVLAARAGRPVELLRFLDRE